MKVLNCCTYEGCAGTERAFVDYTRALCADGHQVTALVHEDAPFSGELDLPGVDVATTEFDEDYRAADIEDLVRLVAAVRPDVVVTHCPSITPDLKFAAGGAAPVVCVVHFESDFGAEDDDGQLQADFIVTLTEFQRENLSAAGWPTAKSAVIPNVIDVPVERPRFAKAWQDPPIIGTLARLSEEKGVDLLIEATRLLRARGVACRTWIGGNGEDEERLVEQARQAGLEEQLRFCGWVDDKRGFYEAIDVFCLPSRYEAFGIVLLEAAVHGRPIVATASSGARDVLSPPDTGVLVVRESAQAIADGLAAVLRDKPAADGMAERAFDAVASRFDRAAVAGRLNAQLEALVAQFRAVDRRVPTASLALT